ncbi:DUF1330 domain-containing protein [Streptomyces sp. JW3]|uniref:DUF1330 domain-containing protein n=1 Tax=Streptomyces sp. JW3 TaxID=3456955 RepID=UPI003FA4C89A
MSAYVIMIREHLRDTAELDIYTAGARAARAGHDITPLAAYGRIDVLEGPPAEGVLINRFPTREAALAWYHSEQYQAALPHRHQAADYRVLIVEGIDA